MGGGGGVSGADGWSIDVRVRIDHPSRAEAPVFRDLVECYAGEQRGRLQGCPSGDGFARLVDQDRSAGEVGDDLRIRRASGSTTDEGDLTVAAGKVVGTGQEVADDPFDGGTGELLAG